MTRSRHRGSRPSQPAIAWLVLLLALVSPAAAYREPAVCGTDPEAWRAELALSRKSRKQRARLTGSVRRHGLITAPSRALPTAAVGNIAIIEGTPDVVARVNPFDLAGRAIRFTPTDGGANAYRVELSSELVDQQAAMAGTAIDNMGDDDTRLLQLPFSFPFYGRTYRQIYINSDGNLTFGQPDVATSERSLGRAVSGPPRIAPLFADLDPTKARQGIRVLVESTQLTVTWLEVPEFREVGVGPHQTFRVRLYKNGQIEFAYGATSPSSAVVGIAPGNRSRSTTVVSFSEGVSGTLSGAILERFTSIQEIDLVELAQRFYASHDDAYDYLVVFNDLGVPAGTNALAYEITVRNHRRGIGQEVYDAGQEFGSPRRLQAILNMGPLSQYPDQPYAVVEGRFVSGDTPLTLLAHEAGHLFLAYVSVADPLQPTRRPMLGRQNAHWSFNFNSEASFLEGNEICDRQLTPASCPSLPTFGRFVTTATVQRYSALDQYLMGVRSPSEVSPTFLVENSGISPSRPPQVGVGLNGERWDIRVEDLIQAEGLRIPDHTVEQHRFRFAFILVVPEGESPRPEAVAKVDRFRQAFETFFHERTEGRAWAETNLAHGLHLSLFPAAGVLRGQGAPAYVVLDRPAQKDLVVNLSPAFGYVEIPSSVVIPAGARAASFVVTGRQPGVDEVVATIAEGAYMTARAKIQVAELSDLQVNLVAGATALRQLAPDQYEITIPQGTEEVALELRDRNRLPYSGVAARLQLATDSGSVVATTTSDTNGNLRFFLPSRSARPSSGMLRLQAAAQVPLPALAAGGFVNAASFRGPVTPGSLASLFGTNLSGGATAVAERLPLPTRLADVEVWLGERKLPLLYVSDSQINLYVPEDVPLGQARLQVFTRYGPSVSMEVTVEPYSPGIFLVSTDGEGAVTVTQTGLPTSLRPARPGEWVEIYGTGLGPVEPDDVFGVLRTTATPTVILAGRHLTPTFSGLAPNFEGLYQVNVQVPPDLPAGRWPLQIVVNGLASNQVYIHVGQ